MTMRQHGLQDDRNVPRNFAGAMTALAIDTPNGSPQNWAECLRDTGAFFTVYRRALQEGGWTERDVECCVEEVFSKQ
jgi:hypothetical protein